MIDDPQILRTLCLGLLCWAIGASLAAWKWRRSYRGALSQFGLLLNAAAPKPTKSEPHVKAARTRLQRQRDRVLAKMKDLQAELHARDLGW